MSEKVTNFALDLPINRKKDKKNQLSRSPKDGALITKFVNRRRHFEGREFRKEGILPVISFVLSGLDCFKCVNDEYIYTSN